MKRKILATVVAGTLLLGATSATSDYMHYQDGTISICDPNDSTKCITMKDRNEGATQAGVGCFDYASYCYEGAQNYDSIQDCIDGGGGYVYCMGWKYFGDLFTDEEDCNDRGHSLFETCMAEQGTGMYGKHFQWGNNHGFASCNRYNCSTFPGGESTSNSQINCSTNSPSNPVNSSVFIVGYFDYCTTRNDNLRGGENDSQSNNRGFDETNNTAINPTDRQGPCGEGYHVPSIGEWNKVLEYWAEENNIDLEDHEGLKYNYFTMDGLKFQEDFKIPFAGYRSSYVAEVYVMWAGAFLWSSSPSVGLFHLGPYEAYPDSNFGRADAFSLRCFKDSYLEFPSSEGGDSEIIVNIAEFNGGQNTCTGSNFIFENIVAGTSTGTHTLSGVFECAFGNGRTSSTVTLQLSGNLVADGDRVISGSNLMMKNSEWTVSPAGLKFANTLINTWNALTATQTLFQKTANLIGVASGVVEVQLTVPGGTPDGTYNGVLVLTY